MMRLFLTRRAEGTLFEALEPIPRREYLTKIFGSDIKFQHFKNAYVYTAFFSFKPPYIAGVIGRERTRTVGGPPEEMYRHQDVSDWKTANVFIDTTAVGDGQKVAMQLINDVGQPLAIFRSLVDHINEHNPDSDWIISVNPIVRTQEFWSVVKEYEGRIGEMDLTFIAPNIWGAETETEKALKKLHKQNNAQQVEVRLKNSENKLNPDSQDIRQSVDYITKGGGEIVLKDDGKKIFSSEDSVMTETLEPDFEIESSEPGMIENLISRLFQ